MIQTERIPIPTDKEFKGDTFQPAAMVKEIAEELLDKHHRFVDFRSLSIDYLWKAQGGKSQGRPRLAQIMKVSGVWTHYADAQFIVWVAADHLTALFEGAPQAPRRAMEALIYHELCHLTWDAEQGEAKLQGPEFAGFLDELALYGDVLPDLRKVRETIQQLPLFGVEGEA